MSATTGRSAGRDPPAAVFHYSRDRSRRSSRPSPERLWRHPAGGRLCRVQSALRAGATAGTAPRGGVLVACPTQVLRARRCRRQGARQAAGHRPARARGGPAHGRDLRHRAGDQRPHRRPSGSPCARSGRRRSCAIWRPGCARNARASRAMPMWRRRWTTCSSAGPPSRASSTTAASA